MRASHDSRETFAQVFRDSRETFALASHDSRETSTRVSYNVRARVYYLAIKSRNGLIYVTASLSHLYRIFVT